MKRLLTVLAIGAMLTSCTKEMSAEVKQDTDLTVKVNGIEYKGWKLETLQIDEYGNYRITALISGRGGIGSTYQVWYGVKPERVSFSGVNNSAGVPAVLLEHKDGVWTKNFLIQIPPGYSIRRWFD